MAAAVARVIGMVATGWHGLRERLRGSHGPWVATGMAWVRTRSLWSNDRSQIRGFELAFNGHGVLTSTATAIRTRVTAILVGVLVVVLGFVVGGGSAAGSSSVGGGRSVAVTDLANTVVIKNFAFGPASLAVARERSRW